MSKPADDYPIVPPGMDVQTSEDPIAYQWRRVFARMNNYVESAPTDPGLEALADNLDAAGVKDFDQRQIRFRAYLDERHKGAHALIAEIDAAGLPRNIKSQIVLAYYRLGPPARSLAELFADGTAL